MPSKIAQRRKQRRQIYLSKQKSQTPGKTTVNTGHGQSISKLSVAPSASSQEPQFLGSKQLKRKKKNKKKPFILKRNRTKLIAENTTGINVSGAGVLESHNYTISAESGYNSTLVPGSSTSVPVSISSVAGSGTSVPHSATNTTVSLSASSYPQTRQQQPFSRMSLNRAIQRNMNPWDRSARKDYFDDMNFGYGGGEWNLYTDFSQDWPSPLEAQPRRRSRLDNHQAIWQQREQGRWFGSGHRRGDYRNFEARPEIDISTSSTHEEQLWRSGFNDSHNISQQNNRNRDKMHRSSAFRDHGRGDNSWQNLARHFGQGHFHREDVNSAVEELSSSGGSLGTAQADSSVLDDSSSSGTSRKRPRSLDRGGQLSKTSRADSSPNSSIFLRPNSVRASSLTNLSERDADKPDSTSKQAKAHKGQEISGKGAKSTAGPTPKFGGLGVKKKHASQKHKTPKVTDTAAKSDGNGRETAGEGVLERAERMCQELREKRQQAGQVRASSSALRIAELRGALNTSERRFHQAHKSFLRGYMSDSSAPNTGPAVGSSTMSTVQKKHFSSSTSSEPPNKAKPVTSCSSEDVVASSALSSSGSSQVSDIDRIRRTIESSVIAEGRVGRSTARERSLSGNYSPSTSVSSSVTQSAGVSSSSAVSKPPLPLSKDALARMVKAPQSRNQRLQLARILRQHTAPAVTRPRRITLAGLYNTTEEDDGDSIGDVLKNISGLEAMGECPELKNIKLEDLTNEDKLRIAQLIEDVDSTGKDSEVSSGEIRDEFTVARSQLSKNTRISRSRSGSLDRDRKEVTPTEQPRPGSQQRLQSVSPSPSRPLSLDDLNTEERQRYTTPPPSASPARSQSPAQRPSAQSSSPVRPAAVRPLSPEKSTRATENCSGRAEVNSDDLDKLDTNYHNTEKASPEHRLRPSPHVPMEVTETTEPDVPISAGAQFSREAGVLHEVMEMCQKQDAVVGEMRDIDVELSQMYKSLIEIVARMSGLQRRRVQLQSEGEDLSQRRNNLLAGLLPDSSLSLRNFTRGRRPSSAETATTGSGSINSAAEVDSQAGRSSTASAEGRPLGSSVILPSWLASPFSSSQASGVSSNVSAEGTAVFSHPVADVCLSGSVTSSVGSITPRATPQDAMLDSHVREAGHAAGCPRVSGSVLNSRPSSATGAEDRAGRVMLSIDGGVRTSSREVAASSVSGAGFKAGAKNSVGADSSSGIGSSISTHTTNVSDFGSKNDTTTPQASQQGLAATPSQSGDSDSTMTSEINRSQAIGGQNTSTSQPKSPSVSVAYLGALSSDLVQQIVRNLPLTSQLGEIGRPSMYMLKTGSSVAEDGAEDQSSKTGNSVRVRSMSVDNSPTKSRVRTMSMHSVSSDLSAGEQSLSSSVPPLKLLEGSDRGDSKTCTPRSESDAVSVTSGTSLGEQIKLMSERNSSSQGTASNLSSLSYAPASAEGELENEVLSVGDMANCSVVLEKLDLDNVAAIPWKVEEDEADRPKKRKTKKDRDQSLQRRRRFVVVTSSEGEEEEDKDDEEECKGEISGAENTVSQSTQFDTSALPGGVELMEADCGPEGQDLDSTMVDSKEHISLEITSPEDEEEVGSSQPSTQRSVSPSRLILDPENLKVFRANVLQNMCTTAATGESSLDHTGGKSVVDSTVTKKESLKISGPCAPVMGMCFHANLLFVGFQGIGVNSYTLTGERSGEYPVDSAQCFTMAPVGSGSQHYLAVGCSDHLTFLSMTGDRGSTSSVPTVVKVLCVLVVDASLFAGLESGAVIVVSLTTLEETRHFQASDRAVHCMTWTREGSTRLLVVAAQDANIHVLDAANGLPIRIISSHSKTAFTLYMLDHFVLSGSGDRKVMAHNIHTAGFAWELHDHNGIVTSVCIDSSLLFTAGYDKIIRCYDLKSRKLLHLLYGAGRSIIMKMTVHNSILYTGNRDGQVEGVDLRDLGSFACQCVACPAVYGLKEHLWHHLVADHLLPNSQAMGCPWSDCSMMLNTGSALVKAGEHMRRHIDSSQKQQSTEAGLEG